jgi:hypothetical protein
MASAKKCEIVDDEEMEKNVSNPFNFRRFDIEELQRRSSPFEKASNQKKVFPFLFQKKKSRFNEEKKISIDELMGKIDSIKLDENNNAIMETKDIIDDYVSHTPEWPKTIEELEAVHQEYIEYYKNLDLKKKEDEIERETNEFPQKTT